jgi:hypothetical protein
LTPAGAVDDAVPDPPAALTPGELDELQPAVTSNAAVAPAVMAHRRLERFRGIIDSSTH